MVFKFRHIVWQCFIFIHSFVKLSQRDFRGFAGVVPSGGRKTSPSTSSTVQIILYFLSLEIRGYILRNQKILTGLDSYSRSSLSSFRPFSIQFCLLIDCLIAIKKNTVCFTMAFVAKFFQGH